MELKQKNTIYTIATDIEHLNMKVHMHTHHHQLVYAIKGTLHVLVEETEYFLPEGFIGLIPSHTLHSLRSRNEMVKLFLVYFPAKTPLPKFTLLSSNDFIIENIRYFSKQPNCIHPTENKIIYNYIYSFICLLTATETQNFFPLKGLIAPKSERLAKVLHYVKENSKDDITLDKVATQFGFTVRNLTRLFKKENITFNNYLNYLRIINAIELFADHKDSIENVALEVGYNSASNFSRTFKKYTGHTPREFITVNTTKSILTH